jgi:hypothetical protein
MTTTQTTGEQKLVYQDTQQRTDIVREPMRGGGEVVYTKESQPTNPGPEEKDLEAQTNVRSNTTASAPPPAITTGPTTTVVNTPPTRRTDVRPQPRENEQSKTGGLLRSFVTKSTGPFFFSLMVGIAFFSFLVLVSSALIEDRTNFLRWASYELLIGQISFAVALGAAIMERIGLLEHLGIRIALAAFLMILWIPSLVIMTFFGTFVSPLFTANGFFGVWGSLIAATILFVHEADRARRNRAHYSSAPRVSLLLLFFFGLMVMGEGINIYTVNTNASGQFVGDLNTQWNYTVFAIAFGAITAFLALLYLVIFEGVTAAVMVALGVVFWLWVVLGFSFLTFVSPFVFATGNGYYACLFTLLSSFGLLVALKRRSDNESNQSQTDLAAERSSHQYFNFMRVMTFASLMVVVAASLVCRTFNGCNGSIQRYQIAAGVIPLGLGLVVVLLEAFGSYRIGGIIKMLMALFLLLWWIGAFIVLTWFGTFISPAPGVGNTFFANGFFFTWVALIAAALAFAEAAKERSLDADPPNPFIAKIGFLLLIIIGSAIELGAAIDYYYRVGNTSMTRYALSVGSISIALVLIMYCASGATYSNPDLHDAVHNVGMYLLTIWWALALLILTFNGYWTRAIDNGYFSLFFTLGACLLAISGVWRHDDMEEDRYADQPQSYTTTTQETRELRGGGPPGQQNNTGAGYNTGATGYTTTTTENREVYRT